MKTILRSLVSKVTVAVAAATFVAALPGQAAMLQLVPKTASVQVGEAIEIDIMASDMNLGGHQLRMSFDPALVGAELFTFGDSMGLSFNDAVLGIDTVSTDEVSFSDADELITTQGDQSGNSFRIGTIRFRALTAGVAKFDFLTALLTSPDAESISAALGSAEVTIAGPSPSGNTETPEPSTALATAAGLLAAVALRRRSYRAL